MQKFRNFENFKSYVGFKTIITIHKLRIIYNFNIGIKTLNSNLNTFKTLYNVTHSKSDSLYIS